jgi:diguanylate cyclase (GGDEF)-like protein
MSVPSDASLKHSIPPLLQRMNGILTSSAIAYMVNAEKAEVERLLEELEKEGVVSRRGEQHAEGWTITEDIQPDRDSQIDSDLIEKLSAYVCSSSECTLPEMMMALKNDNQPLSDRTVLLLRAIRKARENGEFRMLSYLIDRMMKSGKTDLTVEEAGEILAVFEPRKLRYIDCNAAAEFIRQNLPSFGATRFRELALTRLGEIELLENRLPQAEGYLAEALKISMEKKSGDWIPTILNSMAEIPREFETMNKLAAEIGRVTDWLPCISDIDSRVKIQAAAASALAELGMNPAAEETIHAAMIHMPEVSPQTQLSLEWCRAKVFIASGRIKAAMTMLQRVLLMAENVNDQLAIKEILNTIVSKIKERQSYTVRNLISIMLGVSRRASTSGNTSSRLFALDQLVDMYTRTLQFDKAWEAAGNVSRIVRSSDMILEEPLTSWCESYLGFLSGRKEDTGCGDILLPGTDGFLRSLADGIEPISQAGEISDHLMALPGSDSAVYALILALEAYSRGFHRASSTVAAALDSSYSNFNENPCLSWKLCISGILASREQDSDDFFHTAQILARQLDRLLIVWLLLRCRAGLLPDRSFREKCGISLLLQELDNFTARTVPDKELFMRITGAEDRLKSLQAASECRSDNLLEMRDSLARKLEDESLDSLREISEISGRISSRSEISTSLEAIGILLKADRVLTVKIRDGSISIIEGYGTGKWRFPCREVEESIGKFPGERMSVDNFGVNPFGSRRFIIVPTEKSVIPAQMEKRLYSHSYRQGNCILIEADTPFGISDGTVEFFVDCLCRQVGSALLLRDRESVASTDTLTGAAIGHYWTRKLIEILEEGVSEDNPLSILLVDIDGIREINRIFGYRVGDDTMRGIVSTIKGILRPNDLIGRFREDLFAILLPDTGGDNTMMISQRICGIVTGTEIRPDRVPVTVTVGAEICTSSEMRPERIINRAFEALKTGKSQGGNRAVLWTGLKDSAGPDHGELTIFNTGDPGWDHSISLAVLELLSSENASLKTVAEKFRDILRSEFVFLEDCSGKSFQIGNRILTDIPGEISEQSENEVCVHSRILGRYEVLSMRSDCGGRLISAWENISEVSASLKSVFRSIFALSMFIVNRKE